VSTFVYIIYLLLVIYSWLIVARMLLSWFPARFNSPVYPIKRALFWITEPYVSLFRRFLPMTRVGTLVLDLSAVVGLVILFILIQVLGRI
jgi:YggT family protein